RGEFLGIAGRSGPTLVRVDFGLGNLSVVADESVMRGYVERLALDPDDEVVYLADWYRGLTAVDVSDPTEPRPLSAVGGWVWDADVVGDRAFMLSNRTYQGVDVSDPANLSLTGPQLSPAPLGNLLATSRLGFMTDLIGSVIVLDHSGSEVELVGRLGREGSVTALGGELLIVADYDSFDVYNLPDAGLPQIVGQTDFTGRGASMAVNGETVFVPQYYDPEIDVFDISDPTQPVHVSALTVGDRSSGFGFRYGSSAEDGLLAVADTDQGVVLIDTTDPTGLKFLTTIQTPTGSAWDVALRDGLLYVAALYDLLIFDVSAPDEPQLIGRLELPG
ncbi:MAG: hypothetical protein R3324_21640, partial [Halobacteriales archaeon]|nr:hypothetical protein [Halobacteriales archaeon]